MVFDVMEEPAVLGVRGGVEECKGSVYIDFFPEIAVPWRARFLYESRFGAGGASSAGTNVFRRFAVGIRTRHTIGEIINQVEG